jgi:hypothetical protein
MWKVQYKQVPVNRSSTLTEYLNDAELAKHVYITSGTKLAIFGTWKNVVTRITDVSKGENPALPELVHYQANYPNDNHISNKITGLLQNKPVDIFVD